jgi:hypothetical protein
MLYFYDLNKNRSAIKTLIFWLFLGALLYIRYLTGYEFITTITIMIISVATYKLFVNKSQKKEYLKQLIIIGIVSVTSFCAALATHVHSLNDYSGSTGNSINLIKERALERTSESESYLAYPYENYKFLANDVYRIDSTYLNLEKRIDNESEIWANGVALKTYGLLPVIKLPVILAQPFSTYVYSLSVFSLILLILYTTRKKIIPKKLLRRLDGLFLAALIGFVGFLSWLVIARSHSLVHAHINGILIYMPFALFGFMIISLYISVLINKIKK